MAKGPDRLYIDKADRNLYKEIFETGNVFGEKERKENKEQFILAMAIGFQNGIKRSLKSRFGFVECFRLHPTDEALVNAVAIREKKSIEVLSDRKEVFRIAEEYAHAGIRLLYDKITSTQHGSFEKKFEKELVEIYRKLDLVNEEKNPSG